MTVTTGEFAARPASGMPGRTRPPGRSPRHPESDSLEFGAYPGAVPSARLHVRAILAEWELDDLADDAASIVSELMTNAVQAHAREGLEAPVRLTLLAGVRNVLIVVRDASGGTPSPGSPDAGDENGRGLLIVNALSDYWDARPCPGGGKVIRVLCGQSGKHVFHG